MKSQVVIVDDTRTSLGVLRKRLLNLDLDVVTFLDPKECVAQLDSLNPDVFILDVEMPDINGFELCRIIKAIDRFKDIPILFFTSSQGDDALKEAFSAGGFDFLPKSVTEIELSLRVRNALDIVRLQRDQKQRAKMFEVLLRVIYHDLATPIMISQSKVATASESVQDESVKKNLKGAANALETIAALTQDIRAFFTGKLTEGKASVTELIEDLNFLLKDRLAQKGLTIQWSYDENQALGFAMPKTFLVNQVIANFLTNAIKFSNRNGIIDVSFSFSGNLGKIVIRDYGTGMNADQVKRMLEGRLQNLGIGTAGERGTGSGIMIAMHFLEKFNGHISIESICEVNAEAKTGTTITIDLPAQ